MSALEGLAKQLAFELAPIRVNVVQPGPVESELWNGMSKEEFAGFKAGVEKNMPTQRLAQPEDVAETYLCTLKDVSMTGTIIKTDSGATLK